MRQTQTLPAGSCDCHTHVFLDTGEFPLWPARRYTPPLASIEALAAWHDRLGLQRVVIVQPSVYGPDNSSTLHALRVLGAQRARGVAVIDDDTTEDELDTLHAAGVRGVRVNLEVHGESDAARSAAQTVRTAERVASRGWHVQMYASLPLLAACSPTLAALPVPVVLDHFAGADTRRDADHAGIAQVLKLVESGKAYVKLSAPYRCSSQADYRELKPLARMLIRANPDRMLWGSDWPHPRPDSTPDAQGIHAPHVVDLAFVLEQLRDWAGDDSTLHKILVDNPARAYAFPRA